jgi:hypothetical protein
METKVTNQQSKVATQQFQVGQDITFRNKFGEIYTGQYVKDYVYPKTGEIFHTVKLNGKQRLVSAKQIRNASK